ncbi:MAG: autophagy protein 17 [Geoglossum simile]|nr:MAG: autophagy protein 17 [Geoglossum simile]
MDKSHTAYLKTLSFAKLASKDNLSLPNFLMLVKNKGSSVLTLQTPMLLWFERPTEEKMKLYQDSVTKGAMSTSPPAADGQHAPLSTETPMHGSLDASSRPALETLIDHLVASKRSLSSIDLVWRANELVTSARAALEECVILGARSGFLKQGIAGQAKVLRRVRDGIEDVAREGQVEFEAVLRELDAADARLQRTLDILRSTAVEPGFRPTDDEPKTLHDFVDDQGVDNLKSSIRSSIDQVQEAQKDFGYSISSFDSDLLAIEKAIVSITISSPSSSDVLESPIPSLLRSLESHAKEMAVLLQSLVRHFDLCVTAIKHTEGGGAAARSITGDLPKGMGVMDRGSSSSDDDSAPPEPITDKEREDMLDVLSKDAAEVEDVVIEIRDRLAEMEARFDPVSSHVNYLSGVHDDAIAAFRLLEEISTRLPVYVSSSREYLMRWEDEKARIESRMEDLDGLREFYEGFSKAYDGLIIEVGRRRGVQVRMEAIIQEAMVKVEQLHDEDATERETFRLDQGDFLPSDIWPGLSNPPPRYEVVPINKDVSGAPELPKKLIEQALRRAGDLSGKI